MMVRNPHSTGVYVKGYGVVAAGKSAKVRDTKAAKALVKAGVLVDGSEQNKNKEEA